MNERKRAAGGFNRLSQPAEWKGQARGGGVRGGIEVERSGAEPSGPGEIPGSSGGKPPGSSRTARAEAAGAAARVSFNPQTARRAGPWKEV